MTVVANFIKLLEENILYAILVLIWLLFLWKLYLSLRQRALMTRLVELPSSVESFMTKDVYDKARRYGLDRLDFGNFEDTYSNIFTTGILLASCYRHFWQWSIDLANYFGLNPENEIILSGICMLIINVIYDVTDLPLKIYDKFVVEQEHGFNKETPLFFIKDQILKFIVVQAIAIPLLCAVIWIVENGGDYFFLYLWIFSIFVTVIMMIVYPEFIAPLFDKYTPLPDGDLKSKIEALAASLNYPLYKLFIVEGSKRSSHSNAYLYGFYKSKRIVLFDTLVKEYYKPAEGETEIKGCETDEVLGVLAHELGHWKYSHTLKGFLLTQVSFLVNTLLYAKLLNYKPMYEAFGFMDSQPTFIGLIIVTMYILIPINTIIQFVAVVIGRKFEFEADRFAKTLGRGAPLKRALIKLYKDNLGYPLYDKLYSGWHHNHPPLLERLEAIDKED
ncbi:CAAX prenyl protease 1 homolog [Hylaeus anthracinus]|uniref:CAAX prenyl protease 1 homolog n=1 Tax=Hylaeus volcanicus TaxID=313075 RepID=UPI0023B8482D|nr:CAAX prenyl protease 1 homolog [Hylaeus volcanicus]XP_054011199.1 CAAX prenyl protease 1 homolog [Hylaeus anthracinus]